MSEEEAMQILIDYCKKTECDKCKFAHIHYECGLHNPSNWKGIEKDE